jgi:AI-2 transport protein TqsA
MAANGAEPGGPTRWARASTVRVAAAWVVVVAGSWWLLGELAAVLRPLLLAVFLGYVLMPYYSRLRHQMPAPLAIGLLAGVTTGVLVALALTVYASLLGLADELPNIQARSAELIRGATEWAKGLPYVGQAVGQAQVPEREIAQQVGSVTLTVVNRAGGVLVEAAAAGLYLLFLLLESARFPGRVRAAYPPDQAEHILDVFGRINSAIISYLKAKVKSGLVLAVPVGLILAVLGVRFALLWAVLTFLCNFIPYIGTVVAYALPVAFAFLLTPDPPWRPVTAAVLLAVVHAVSASVVEPLILGRAVGLSPLVILAALSVWGLLWGLPGMFLAVPLTVVLKIVFQNIEATRPVARLLSGG